MPMDKCLAIHAAIDAARKDKTPNCRYRLAAAYLDASTYYHDVYVSTLDVVQTIHNCNTRKVAKCLTGRYAQLNRKWIARARSCN